MVNETVLPPFLEWLLGGPSGFGALFYWLIVVAAVTIFSFGLGWLISMVRHGFQTGTVAWLRVLRDGTADMVLISPRRVLAMAGLAFKESIRKRVIVVFALFVLVLLFAGWYLDPSNPRPAGLYISFVLATTSWLVMLLALLLSVFSLPGDMQNKTIYTIVTKPVRPSEIVLGRILGFSAVGTLFLVIMGFVSFIFVVRGIDHTHEIAAEHLKPLPDKPGVLAGYTLPANGHKHGVVVNANGEATLAEERSHWHDVAVETRGDKKAYVAGGSVGMLQARIPVFARVGQFRFCDKTGIDKDKGINVGDEWMYRGFVEGGTGAAAIWTFEGVTPQAFPSDTLPIEMSIGVFRTHKGEITKGVLGSLLLRNPVTGLTVEIEVFESKEFATLTRDVPRKITKFAQAKMISRKTETSSGVQADPPANRLDASLATKKEYDLFEDLVTQDGRLEVWLQCAEAGQYFGAGHSDLYLRAADAPFMANFLKGYLGIGFQMILVIGVGVLFSTFLSGPVAMLATVGSLVAGLFRDQLMKLAQFQMIGGGPFEALVRTVRQDNITTPLEPGFRTDVVQGIDWVVAHAMHAAAAILPPFQEFSYADFVAGGFDIAWNPNIAIPFVRMLAYMLPYILAGYFFFKTREVAR